ncbi:MAG TPA: sigma factor, partial [Rubricoccaceae bacterium]
MPDPSDAWRRALTGDRDAFTEATAPYQETLLTAARRQVQVQREAGTLVESDLTPEELVGETLVRAFDGRAFYDADQMSFRGWLLGLQTRTLARLARDESRHAARSAVSLDEEVPTGANQDTTDEEFWEFHEPFDVLT